MAPTSRWRVQVFTLQDQVPCLTTSSHQQSPAHHGGPRWGSSFFGTHSLSSCTLIVRTKRGLLSPRYYFPSGWFPFMLPPSPQEWLGSPPLHPHSPYTLSPSHLGFISHSLDNYLYARLCTNSACSLGKFLYTYVYKPASPPDQDIDLQLPAPVAYPSPKAQLS